MTALTERRAEFVYEAARLQAIAVDAPVVPEPWTDRDEDFRHQFCEVIERQTGEMRSGSPEELHGGWVQAYVDMGWTYGEVRDTEAKTHPDMVPFAMLEQRVHCLVRDRAALDRTRGSGDHTMTTARPVRFRCKTCDETWSAWSPAERHARESHHARGASTTVEVTE